MVAKGKGKLETYWAEPNQDVCASTSSAPSSSSPMEVANVKDIDHHPGIDEKTNRLVDWNVEILAQHIARIIAHREASCPAEGSDQMLCFDKNHDGTILEEIKEVVEIPFHGNASNLKVERLDPEVLEELRHFVAAISSMYHRNAFHNFEHASHVTMSVIKLQKRIVAPSRTGGTTSLHDHTYGLASDPLTQFACVFSALVHDIDHSGVPNTQLVKEGNPIAKHYQNKSVAEQNSVDVVSIVSMPCQDFLGSFRSLFSLPPRENRPGRCSAIKLTLN